MEFEEVLKRLTQSGVEFVLIGGFAAITHGVSVLTEDLDVCIRFDKANLDRLVRALDGLHPRHRITPQRIPFVIEESNWNHLKNLYLELDNGVLDCLGEVAGIGKFDEVLCASETIRLPFGDCRILTIDQLIRAKEAVGRPKDLFTVRQLMLIKTKRENS
jgi:hypothetical protein